MLSYLESMAIQHNHSPIHDYNEIYQNVVNIIIQPSIYVESWKVALLLKRSCHNEW